MKMFIFPLLLAAVAYGQSHHSCIHNNHQQIEATQVVNNVVSDVDENMDGFLEPSEVTHFLNLFDKDNSGHVMEDEFVKEWHHRYHDHHDFAVYIFHHLDRDMDYEVTLKDLYSLYGEINTDGHPAVTMDEYRTWFMNLYTNCVHIPHHG